MATLTVTARGQVTFRKDVLRHLGVKPGEKIELELMPGGKGTIAAARKTGSIEDFIGVLDGKTRKTVPTRFKTNAGVVDRLQQGRVY